MADLVAGGVITDEAVSAATDLLPAWTKARPLSYSFVTRPTPDGLVVDDVQAGFGRAAAPYLDMLPPEAHATVRTTLDGAFPRGFTEYRPVKGRTEDLHPLLGRSEAGEDPRWADHTPDALEVFHDQEHDELRLRRAGTVVDVLHLGQLTPDALPDRVAVLHADLFCGAVDLDPLRPADGVLRYRDVVLRLGRGAPVSVEVPSSQVVEVVVETYLRPQAIRR
ncbi:hypothetical protein BBK82_32410 [Lentzea guizhouensis]|uniref:Uncharacterized protein n=1 Tax=Lentzea guizhouensis TaxID=1586287 RepID=A0A1B2HQQ6_9PSEU|nr:hypothetical protein [Lentzea guizhouensis]ANZ40043.1 hypothetical protein BBK82_32410 [Lentzea guizhouensis]